MTNDPDRAYEAVRDALQALAHADRSLEAPAHVERMVMEAWDATHPRRVQRRPFVQAAMRMAAAAVVVVAAWMWASGRAPQPATGEHPGGVEDEPLAPAVVHQRDSQPASAAPDAGLPTGTSATPVAFAARAARVSGAAVSGRAPVTVVLVGAPAAPGEQMRVVRMRVGRDTLIAMGLRAIDADDADTVDVEMLVGEDGVARGLRTGM